MRTFIIDLGNNRMNNINPASTCTFMFELLTKSDGSNGV